MATAVVSAASAQEGERSPGGLLDRIFGGTERFGGGERVAQPAAQPGQERAALAASDVVLQLERLEGQIRQLTGAVEQLQFRNQQLEQQVRRMQEDTEYRFQELGSKGTARPAPTRPLATPAPDRSRRIAGAGTARRRLRSRAAPGRARRAANARLGPRGHGTAGSRTNPDDPSVGAPGGRAPGAHTAALPPGASAKDDYDLAYGYVLRKDYALAEEAFRSFLKKYPSDRLAGEATFWLGESLFQRQRYRDAAEVLPQRLDQVRGQSQGARRVAAPRAVARRARARRKRPARRSAKSSRKFPRASASVKQSVEREQKRVRC